MEGMRKAWRFKGFILFSSFLKVISIEERTHKEIGRFFKNSSNLVRIVSAQKGKEVDSESWKSTGSLRTTGSFFSETLILNVWFQLIIILASDMKEEISKLWQTLVVSRPSFSGRKKSY